MRISDWSSDVCSSDLLLRFRSLFLARPDAFACDVVHLRGSQEEMWQKLLQLQFATDPKAVLQWMLDQGLAASLEAYGVPPSEGLREAAAGPRRSDARRVGKACVSTCKSRWSPPN